MPNVTFRGGALLPRLTDPELSPGMVAKRDLGRYYAGLELLELVSSLRMHPADVLGRLVKTLYPELYPELGTHASQLEGTDARN